MIPDADIWHRTAIMIRRYGDTADIEAAKRADEYKAKGERDRQRVWLPTAKAIDDLRTMKPREAKN